LTTTSATPTAARRDAVSFGASASTVTRANSCSAMARQGNCTFEISGSDQNPGQTPAKKASTATLTAVQNSISALVRRPQRTATPSASAPSASAVAASSTSRPDDQAWGLRSTPSAGWNLLLHQYSAEIAPCRLSAGASEIAARPTPRLKAAAIVTATRSRRPGARHARKSA
jgi:hypothetical protein